MAIPINNTILSREQAKELGLKTYFTGKPCKHGHVSNRTVSEGKCQECERLRSSNRYKNNAEYRTKNIEKIKEYRGDPIYRNKELAMSKLRHLKHPEKRIFYSAKKRAKENGREFSIKLSDIPDIPFVCPILGINLVPSSANIDEIPTLDRIDNAFGYIRGNIAIISFRANRLKADGRADEFRKIANWVQEHS